MQNFRRARGDSRKSTENARKRTCAEPEAWLGVNLTDEQARAFAFVCRYGEATLPQLKAVTGLPTQKAATVLELLATQKLIEPAGTGGRYALTEPVAPRQDRSSR